MKKVHKATQSAEETERAFKERRWAPTACGAAVRSRPKITQDAAKVTCYYCKAKEERRNPRPTFFPTYNR